MAVDLDRMVQVLARIEVARLGQANVEWDQNSFGRFSLWERALVNRVDEVVAATMEARPEVATTRGWGYLIYDPETHEVEGLGSCNTGFCAAGFACEEAKVPLVFERMGRSGMTFQAFRTVQGQPVSQAACDWLGIPYKHDEWSTWALLPATEEDAEKWSRAQGYPRFFDMDNTLDQMYEYAYEWVADQVSSEEDLRERVSLRTEELWAKLIEADQTSTQ